MVLFRWDNQGPGQPYVPALKGEEKVACNRCISIRPPDLPLAVCGATGWLQERRGEEHFAEGDGREDAHRLPCTPEGVLRWVAHVI